MSLYDPNNDTTRLDESTLIMDPVKARTLGDVQLVLSRWEYTMTHRSKTLGRFALDDDLKRSVLLKILLASEERELKNQRLLYKSVEALRTRVLERINGRRRRRE